MQTQGRDSVPWKVSADSFHGLALFWRIIISKKGTKKEGPYGTGQNSEED